MNRQNTMLQRAWSILGYGAGGKRLAAAILLVAFALSSVFPALATTGTGGGTYPNPISIKDNDASPSNPNAITVAGVPFGGGFRITAIRVKLNGLYHYFPKDIDLLLQAPDGSSMILMSDVGGGTPGVPLEAPVNILFRDGGSASLFSSAPVNNGQYAPSDFTPGDDIDKFQAVVPPPYKGTFAQFTSADPNGVWKLLMFDDQAADSGALLNGWTLEIDYSNEVPQSPQFATVAVNPDGPVDEQSKDNAEPTAIVANNRTLDGKAVTVTLTDSDTTDPSKITVTGVHKDTDLFTFSKATRRTDSWIWDVFINVNAERPLTEPSKKGKLEITATDDKGNSSTTTVEVEIRGVNDRPYFQANTTDPAPINNPLPGALSLMESSAPGLIDLATFRVNDVETPREQLLVLLNSDNKDLIDPANAVITGPSINGVVNVQIKQTANKYGVANISVTVADKPGQPYPNVQGISRFSEICKITVGNVGINPVLTLVDGTTFTIEEDSLNKPFKIKNEDIDDPPSSLINSVTYKTTDPAQPKLFGEVTGSTLQGVVIPQDNMNDRTLLFSPSKDKFGTTILLVSVKDSEGNTDTKELTVIVTPTPDAITLKFDSASVGPVDEDSFDADPTKTSIKNFFTITDPDYPNRTIGVMTPPYDGTRWTSSNRDIVNDLDQSNFVWTKQKIGDKDRDVLLVRPVQDASGTVTITMEVIDNTRGASFKGMDTFTLTIAPVNDAPRITFGTGDTTIVWGTPNTTLAASVLEGSDILGTTTPNYLFWVRVSDPENPTSSIVKFESKSVDLIPNKKENIRIGDGLQSGLETNTTVHTELPIVLIPKDNNVNGKATIEITATDKDGKVNVQKVELTIDPGNDRPLVDRIDNVSTTDGVAVAKELIVSEVTGGTGETAASALILTAEINDLAFVQRFFDPAATVPYTLPVAVNGASRVIFFQVIPAVPPVTVPESTLVTIRVQDTGSPLGELVTALTFIVNKFNNPPQVEFITGDMTTLEDVPVVAQIRARDIDVPPDAITLNVTSDNQSLVPNGRISTQVISGPDANGWYYYSAYISPSAELSGTANIIATVSDNITKSVTATRKLTVTPDEEAPRITNESELTDTSIEEDKATDFVAKIFDSEASVNFGGATWDDVKVEITSSEIERTSGDPDFKHKLGISKVSGTVVNGVLEWKFKITPPQDFWTSQLGTTELPFTVTLKVTDKAGLTDTWSFLVTVTRKNDPAVIVKDTDFGNALREGSKTDDPIKNVISMQEDGSAYEVTFNFSDVNTAWDRKETPVADFTNWRNPDTDDAVRNFDANKPNIRIINVGGSEALVPADRAWVKGKDKTRILHLESLPNKWGKGVIGIQFTDGGDPHRATLDVADNEVSNTYYLEVVVNAVNDAPTMSLVPPVTINEDRNPTTGQEKVFFTVDDQETLDYNLLELQVEALNPGLFERTIWENDPIKQSLIDSGVGFIAWGGVNNWRSVEFFPKRNMSGKSEVKLTLTDEQKANFTQIFLVTVNSVNDAPTFSGLPEDNKDKAITVTESQANNAPDFVKQTFSVSDVDNPFTDLTVTAKTRDNSGSIIDQNVLPNANILLTLADDPNESGQNAANLFVTMIPEQSERPNVWGLVRVTLSVKDKDGATGNGSFWLKIVPDNDPPFISVPGILNIAQNGSQSVPFWVQDAFRETTPANLLIVATSSNPTLIPNGSIVIGRTTVGNKDEGTIVITPTQGQTGQATLSFVVTDDGKFQSVQDYAPGAVATQSYTATMLVTVGEVPNTPPTISNIPNQTTKMNQFIQVPFSIGDAETPVDQLTVFGQSSNPVLIPNSAIFLSGTGANRSAFIVPAPNQTGACQITVTVADGAGLTSQTVFTVNVSDPVVQNVADFNGDGKPDLLLQRNDGTMAVWYIQGTEVKGGSFIDPSNPGPGWNLITSGDFSGDGSPDLLFQHVDGSVAIWAMNGAALVTPGFLTPSNAGTEWTAAAVADINADGKLDIIYQHVDGSIATWLMDGTTALEYKYVNPMAPSDANYRVIGAGDLNGDKKPDLVFQNRATAEMAVWFMDGLNMTTGALFNPSAPADPTFKASAVADYNGDGKADVVFYNGTMLATWFMNGANLTSGAFFTTAPGESGWSVVGP